MFDMIQGGYDNSYPLIFEFLGDTPVYHRPLAGRLAQW